MVADVGSCGAPVAVFVLALGGGEGGDVVGELECHFFLIYLFSYLSYILCCGPFEGWNGTCCLFSSFLFFFLFVNRSRRPLEGGCRAGDKQICIRSAKSVR